MKQEIVKIDLPKPSVPVLEGEAVSESIPCPASVLSGIPVIEMFMSGVTVRIPQGTDAAFLEQVLRILGRALC